MSVQMEDNVLICYDSHLCSGPDLKYSVSHVNESINSTNPFTATFLLLKELCVAIVLRFYFSVFCRSSWVKYTQIQVAPELWWRSWRPTPVPKSRMIFFSWEIRTGECPNCSSLTYREPNDRFCVKFVLVLSVFPGFCSTQTSCSAWGSVLRPSPSCSSSSTVRWWVCLFLVQYSPV